MRKITEESINAFLNRTKFKKQNMEVTLNNYNNETHLELHGNTIAILNENNEIFITNCGWESNTTKERLNALPNVSIRQKNFQWFLNGELWDGKLTKIK
tara:strand:+ start:7720 stop:8016 length:297 start_codon:yes stop_codon:yes gene_type:complete